MRVTGGSDQSIGELHGLEMSCTLMAADPAGQLPSRRCATPASQVREGYPETVGAAAQGTPTTRQSNSPNSSSSAVLRSCPLWHPSRSRGRRGCRQMYGMQAYAGQASAFQETVLAATQI